MASDSQPGLHSFSSMSQYSQLSYGRGFWQISLAPWQGRSTSQEFGSRVVVVGRGTHCCSSHISVSRQSSSVQHSGLLQVCSVRHSLHTISVQSSLEQHSGSRHSPASQLLHTVAVQSPSSRHSGAGVGGYWGVGLNIE